MVPPGQNEQFISRDQDKALSLYIRGYSMDSSQINCLYGMGSVYMEQGRFEESFTFMESFRDSLLARNTFNPFRTMILGFIYQKCGKTELARELFDEQVVYCNRMFSRDPNTHGTMAIIYAQTGNEKMAMDHLRSLNKMPRCDVYAVRNLEEDLFFTAIQDDPEFRQIRTEVNLKFQAEHERVARWLRENEIL
jgi:tetratricopeptide (TPR) repeat protein